MKIFWLTPTQLLYALIVGGAIALIATFALVPHPVDIPVQVITPVPTPPPVVITAQPTPVPTPVVTDMVITTSDGSLVIAQNEIAQTVQTAIGLMFWILPMVIVFHVMWALFGRRFGRDGDM
jgi:hypothetical protein